MPRVVVTFGLLGALASGRTSHFGAAPECVITTVHPGGKEPGRFESKRMVSAPMGIKSIQATTQTAKRISIK